MSSPSSFADLYNFPAWSKDHFTLNSDGEVAVLNPLDPSAKPVSLYGIVEELHSRGIASPVLVRVEQFLKNSIDGLHSAFGQAIESAQYKNRYQGVFPIKVNQQSKVISNIVEMGRPYHYGLEAGSKPELVVALSQPLSSQALIVCNGVKDAEFVELAMMSNCVGFNTIIVIESPKELDTIIAVHKRTGMKPRLGVRIKLTHRIQGKWQESSGDRSTFGLNTLQLINIVDKLCAHDLLDCLVLQHSHLGSQIPDIIDVRYAVSEACRYFSVLKSEGVPLQYLDIGGGLGVDYSGDKMASETSINYTIPEYATNVVETIKYALDEAGISHPILVSESGRAVVARSSILITNVIEDTRYDADEKPVVSAEDHHLLRDLADVERYIEENRLQECLNDAQYYRDEMRALFRRGHIGIRETARGEEIYLYLMARIKRSAMTSENLQVLEQLDQNVDIYHCNFSLFQSLPDSWAIDQVHPVMPLQRLTEEPTRKAILADITCDSDGKLENFIQEDGLKFALPVHRLTEDPYYIGIFYVGAYQETLGDLHNLFGDTNVAVIRLTDDGFDLVHDTEGDTIAEVLSYVEYDHKDCLENFRATLDRAVSDKRINGAERRAFAGFYRECMNGYTYYEL